MKLTLEKGSVKLQLLDGSGKVWSEQTLETSGTLETTIELDVPLIVAYLALVPNIINHSCVHLLFDDIDYKTFIDARAQTINYDYTNGMLY